MPTYSDSGDYAYHTPEPRDYTPAQRFCSSQTGALPPMTGPERMQAEIDALLLRVAHLELHVHRLLNPGEDGQP